MKLCIKQSDTSVNIIKRISGCLLYSVVDISTRIIILDINSRVKIIYVKINVCFYFFCFYHYCIDLVVRVLYFKYIIEKKRTQIFFYNKMFIIRNYYFVMTHYYWLSNAMIEVLN